MISEAVPEAVRALHARGRDAWPDVVLDLATFSALARRIGDGPFDDVHADDFYLAIACAAGIDRALAVLDRHYLSGLRSALVRRGHDPAAAEDVVQALRMRFLVGEPGRGPRIIEYNGRGSLATWIRVVGARSAISARRRHDRELVTEDIDTACAARSPELEVLRKRFGVEFQAAFRVTFESLTGRDRSLLRYQVIDRVGIDRIAAIYGVHRATAARWVAHAREALIVGVRRALQAELRISADELDSLFRAVESDVELSLQLFLTPTIDRGSRPQTPRARPRWRR